MEKFTANTDSNEVVDPTESFEQAFKQDEQFAEATAEQEDTKEKESWYVRAKLGRLALKVVSDPFIAVSAASWGLNTFANAHNPNMVHTVAAVSAAVVGGLRANTIAKRHLGALEQQEIAQEEAEAAKTL